MSEMLRDLVGKRCRIRNDEMEYLTGSADVDCRVLDADEEWIKVAFVDENGNRIARLARIESLERVTVYEETR